MRFRFGTADLLDNLRTACSDGNLGKGAQQLWPYLTGRALRLVQA